jgi:hypothetical protein
LLKAGSEGEDIKNKINLQTIITTHSSHIVSDCDFDDIKYFKKIKEENNIVSKNMKNLEAEYKFEKEPNNKRFKFLKQYLTLNYAEIFFADKVIMYEGDTERILLPAMMKKIDQEETDKAKIPLLSQNITLLESGANSQLFDKFIQFIDVKTLIITDIDAGIEIKKKDKNGVEKTVIQEIEVEKGTTTSNNALKYYYKNSLAKLKMKPLKFFKTRKKENKILSNKSGEWQVDKKGKLMVAYQTEEQADGIKYYPRSFEDAFIFCNREFIFNNIDSFSSLNDNKIDEATDDEYTAYMVATNCIKSKPAFALDILLNSEADKNKKTDFPNWQIPPYIKEGLEWLRED